jgi:SH3-like domain-containing protein
MNRKQFLSTALAGFAMASARPIWAQESQADEAAARTDEALQDQDPAAAAKPVVRDPTKGAVTNLPIPRYVSLKGREGNARRGPSLTHRIDWVFKASGMPLKITAEHEHWRRVEDQEGMGGWVHYSLLSGVRTVLVVQDLAEFHDSPEAGAAVSFKAERNVIGKLLECNRDWCRVSTDGDKGWILKTALWGVDPEEILT